MSTPSAYKAFSLTKRTLSLRVSFPRPLTLQDIPCRLLSGVSSLDNSVAQKAVGEILVNGATIGGNLLGKVKVLKIVSIFLLPTIKVIFAPPTSSFPYHLTNTTLPKHLSSDFLLPSSLPSL